MKIIRNVVSQNEFYHLYIVGTIEIILNAANNLLQFVNLFSKTRTWDIFSFPISLRLHRNIESPTVHVLSIFCSCPTEVSAFDDGVDTVSRI